MSGASGISFPGYMTICTVGWPIIRLISVEKTRNRKERSQTHSFPRSYLNWGKGRSGWAAHGYEIKVFWCHQISGKMSTKYHWRKWLGEKKITLFFYVCAFYKKFLLFLISIFINRFIFTQYWPLFPLSQLFNPIFLYCVIHLSIGWILFLK